MLLAATAAVMACGEAPAAETHAVDRSTVPGAVVVVRDTTITAGVETPARVEPFLHAILGTKVMGRVVDVMVREGDRVVAGAVLVRLDARDLEARRTQAGAGLKAAEAAHQEAELAVARLRTLFADSAAPRAHLDAAEAGFTRAGQAVVAARAAVAEVEAVIDYAEVRAPFAGTVVQRLVDPGAFAAPGTPLLRIEDATQLRVIASVPPSGVRGLARGARVEATLEGVTATGVVEGVVPVAGASLVDVQVLVDNAGLAFSSGSAATLAAPGAPRRAILVPEGAVVRSGDLTGVHVRASGRDAPRWVRLGGSFGGLVEVLSGLTPGDSVVVPAAPAGA